MAVLPCRYPYDDDADRFIQSNILEIELVESPADGKVRLNPYPSAVHAYQ